MGLPILSTMHTAASDLIDEDVQGFLVEPRRPDLLAERIAWANGHREALRTMRGPARAEQFTWEHFRTQTADAVRAYLATAPAGYAA